MAEKAKQSQNSAIRSKLGADKLKTALGAGLMGKLNQGGTG
jgi:hypothetical protein